MPSDEVWILVGIWFSCLFLFGATLRGQYSLLEISVGSTLVPFFHASVLFITARYWAFKFNGLTYVISLVGLSAGFALLAKRTGAKSSTPRSISIVDVTSFGPKLQTWLGLLFLLGAIALNMTVWSQASNGFRLIPNHDAVYHATQISNAIKYHSLGPDVLYASLDGLDNGRHLSPGGLYPLVAALGDMFGVLPSRALYDIAFVVLTILWPISLYFFVRAIVPTLHAWAGVAAVLGSGLYLLPFGPLSWGGVPMAVGVVVLNIATAAFVLSVRRSVETTLIIGAVGGFTLAAIHTSEFFIFLIWIGIALVSIRFPSSASQRSEIGRNCLAVLLVAVGMAWSNLENLVGRAFIRPLGQVTTRHENPVEAIGQMVFLSAYSPVTTVLPLVLLVASLFWRPPNRDARFAFRILGSSMVLCLLVLGAGRPFLDRLSWATDPWYRQYARVSYLLVSPLAVVGSIVISFAWSSTFKTRSLRNVPIARLAASVVLLSVVAASLVAAVRSTKTRATQVFAEIGALSEQDSVLPKTVPELMKPNTRVLATLDTGLGHWWSDHEVWIAAAGYMDGETRSLANALADTIPNYLADSNVRELYERLGITLLATNRKSLGGFNRPDETQVRHSGAFVPIATGNSVTVWRLADVGITTLGDLGPWRSADETGNESAPIFGNVLTVRLENLSESSVRSDFKLYFRPPDCSTAQVLSVTSDATSVKYDNNVLSISVALQESQTLEIPLTFGDALCSTSGAERPLVAWLDEVERGSSEPSR
jgi:hypothetical protein